MLRLWEYPIDATDLASPARLQPAVSPCQSSLRLPPSLLMVGLSMPSVGVEFVGKHPTRYPPIMVPSRQSLLHRYPLPSTHDQPVWWVPPASDPLIDANLGPSATANGVVNGMSTATFGRYLALSAATQPTPFLVLYSQHPKDNCLSQPISPTIKCFRTGIRPCALGTCPFTPGHESFATPGFTTPLLHTPLQEVSTISTTSGLRVFCARCTHF